jgi:hypothetical protein
MPLQAVPYALRCNAESPAEKLIFIAIVADCGDPEDEAYVPAFCQPAEVRGHLERLQQAGLLVYLRIHPDGSVIAEPALPEVIPASFGDRP